MGSYYPGTPLSKKHPFYDTNTVELLVDEEVNCLFVVLTHRKPDDQNNTKENPIFYYYPSVNHLQKNMIWLPFTFMTLLLFPILKVPCMSPTVFYVICTLPMVFFS